MRVTGARVSANLFEALGVRAGLGRGFHPGEERRGAEAVVVLSHGMWQEQFGGSRSAVGSTLVLDAVPHTIVGVMPCCRCCRPTRRAWSRWL